MASIYKEGNSWRCIVRRVGHATQSRSFDRKIDAEKWGRALENSMDEHRFIEPIKEITSALFERYLKEVAPHRAGARFEQTRLRAYMRSAAFMKLPLHEVDAAAIRQWRDSRLKKVQPATVNREMNLLSSVFTHAIKEWGYPLKANPMSLVKRPPKGKARRRRVGPGELEKIYEVFGKEVPTHGRSYGGWMFEFGMETGLRLSELCRLRWCDVHTTDAWLYVLPGKNGDDRTVPLTSRAIQILEVMPKRGERVFPLNAASFGTQFREGLKETGIADLHFHDSRHEATSRMAKVLSVLELATVIGHRDLKSLMVYYNPTARELAQKLHGASLSTPPRP